MLPHLFWSPTLVTVMTSKYQLPLRSLWMFNLSFYSLVFPISASVLSSRCWGSNQKQEDSGVRSILVKTEPNCHGGESPVVFILKVGKLDYCTNHRKFSSFSITTEVPTSIMVGRLIPIRQSIIHDRHAGWQNGLSWTEDAIMSGISLLVLRFESRFKPATYLGNGWINNWSQ